MPLYYSLKSNKSELRSRPNTSRYEMFRLSHQYDYCDDMDATISAGISSRYEMFRLSHQYDDCDEMDAIICAGKKIKDVYNQDDIDENRQQLVNTIPKTEQDFMETFDRLKWNEGFTCEGVELVRLIMEMEKEVKEYNEEHGFDFDTSVVGDIGKLYSMWIYAITDEVDFELEDDGYESGDEVILLRPQ